MNGKVYHCRNQKVTKHPEGYDLCVSCAKSLKDAETESIQENIYATIKRFIQRSSSYVISVTAI